MIHVAAFALGLLFIALIGFGANHLARRIDREGGGAGIIVDTIVLTFLGVCGALFAYLIGGLLIGIPFSK